MSRSALSRTPLLLFLVLLLLTTPAPRAHAAPRWADGEVLIKFKPNAKQSDIAKVKAALRATRIKHFRRIGAERDRISGLTVEDAVARFRGNPAVEYIEPNYIVQAVALPNDPLFSQQWALRNTGQTGGRVGADISATQAWDVTTGSDILVAMIDTGVDYTHPDLAANIYVNPGEIPGNGIDDDGNGFVDDVHGWDFQNEDNDPMDDNGHGTHTAGTVGAVGNNGIGVAGICWHVKLLPLKFIGPNGLGLTSDGVECIEYATMMHARLSSNSWGGGAYSQALADAVQEANDAGIFVVTAAGNFVSDNDKLPFYPATLPTPNVISVAATNSMDGLANFSNYGVQTVDLAAPGVDVLSTWPGNTYQLGSGTSMACPHAAGALALILSKFPDLSMAHAKRLLMDSTDPLDALHGIVASGGRLNVARAMAGPDTIPPGAIQDLAVLATTSNRVRLGWTANGNNGSVGAALRYDLRYDTTPITAATFETAPRFAATPGPAVAGTHQDVNVTGLIPSTNYYFAMKAVDGFDNASPISNLVGGTTLPPPDIHVDASSFRVSLGPEGTETRRMNLSNPSAGVLDFEIGYASAGTPTAAAARLRTQLALAGATTTVISRTWADHARDGTAGVALTSGAVTVSSGDPPPVVIAEPTRDAAIADLSELRAAPGQTDLDVELDFSTDIDRLHFGGFLYLDIDQNRYTGVPPEFGRPGQDIGAEFEVQLFSLPAGTVGLYYAPTHTLVATLPATVASRSIRFALPLWMLGEDEGGMDVTGVVGTETAATDWFPNAGHGTVRSVRWMRVSSESGAVPPGGTLPLDVTFDARGLRAGGYDGVIQIRSNDPDQPLLSIGTHADVLGLPRVEISSLELDFGAVPLGSSRADTMVVSNSGTSTLHVTAIVSDHPAFTVGIPSLTLEPGARGVVPITFSPTAIGPASGSFQVSTDDPDATELFGSLSGSGVPPPDIQVSTEVIRADLKTGETATRPLTVSNTGSGDLNVTFTPSSDGSDEIILAARAPNPNPIPRNGGTAMQLPDSTPVASAVLGGPSAQIPVLVIQDTKAWLLDVGAMIHDRFGLPVRVIHSAQVAETDFSRYDLIVTVGDELPEYYDAISTNEPKFTEYVRAGGTVLYLTAMNPGGVRLAGGARYDFGNYEDANRPLDPGHPILYGLPWLLADYFINYGTLSKLPPGASVLTETQLTHLPTTVEYTLGRGRVVATGMIWEIEYTNGGANWPLLPQAVAYCLSRVPPRWLRVDPPSGVVAPGQSLTTQLSFDARWASGGAHDGWIHVRSNDPDHADVAIPAHLEVTPLPDIELSQTTLDFGSVFVNGSRTDSLHVSNQGTTTLNVSDVASDNPAYLIGTTHFSIATGETAAVVVTFHPGSLGVANGTLRIRSDDPDEPVRTVSLAGEGVQAPIASVDPVSLEFSLAPGKTDARTLILTNAGGAAMTFVSEFQAPPGAASVARVGAAVTAHVGGPDRFGHTWIDSDEPGGPPFEWVEISGIGTRIPMLGNNILSAPIPIGFEFPFYGGAFTSFRISSNGNIAFTSHTSDWQNLPLPATSAPDNLIAPFWDDIGAAFISNTYVHFDGTRTIIQFQDYIQAGAHSLDDTYTFEIILYPSGEFRFQYLKMEGPKDGATIGFQNGAKDDGLMVAFNTPYLHDRLAVRVTSRPRWISLEPGSGSVSARGTTSVRALVDATGLSHGSYATTLLLHSNDPVTPVLRIPVQMHVLAAVDAVVTKITPTTFGPQSGGKAVQAFVELPPGVDPAQVVLSSVRFQGTVPCTQKTLKIVDFNANGIPDLQFQFDRSAAQAVLPAGNRVEVTVTGEVGTEARFTGRATVRVVQPHVTVSALHQNQPNPFNPTTIIGFDLPRASDASLRVYTADGRQVRALVDRSMPAGMHQVIWDGRDDRGRPAASGVYYYRLVAGDFRATRRLVLMK